MSSYSLLKQSVTDGKINTVKIRIPLGISGNGDSGDRVFQNAKCHLLRILNLSH